MVWMWGWHILRILLVLIAMDTNLRAELRLFVPTNCSFLDSRMLRCELQSFAA